MPNHVTNEIIIDGTEEEIFAVREYMRSDENPFDFRNLSRMPKELEGTTSPCRIISKGEYNIQESAIKLLNDKVANGTPLTKEEDNKLKWGLSRGITQKMSDELMEKYGYNNWYDWQLAHWGTKWNSYSHWNMDDMDANEFGFQTAWAHPMPIIEALSIKFPNIRFKIKFADEDFGHNLGSYEILDGLIENEFFPEGGSTEACMLALEVQGGEDYYLYDQFVEGYLEEDEGLDEFEMIMLGRSVASGSVDEEFPNWILDKALEIALENENFEEAGKIRDYLINY
jgi:hypothetical protein